MVCIKASNVYANLFNFFYFNLGFRFYDSTEKIHVIQWAGFCDDFFHIRYEKEKPFCKLMAKHSNENVFLFTKIVNHRI